MPQHTYETCNSLIKKFFYNMRCFVMFVAAVCIHFLLKLKWPKNKSNLKAVSEPFIFPRHTRNFGEKRDFIHKRSLHMHIYWQPTGYITKRASRQVGGDLFSYYSPPLFPTIANHFQLAL